MHDLEIKEVETEEKTLALELLKQVKANGKRWFIAFIICLAMLFLSNLAWLYAWNLPSEDVSTTSYTADSEESGNAIINDSGEVNIDGESKKDSNKNN